MSYLIRMAYVILIVPNDLPRRSKILFCQEDDIIVLLILVFINNLKENKPLQVMAHRVIAVFNLQLNAL